MKIYQIKENGFLGISMDVDPKDGHPQGWTYDAPPGEGTYKRINNEWVETPEPPNSGLVIDYNNLAEEVRKERNQRLTESDWTQLQDSPVDKDLWVEYRQKLRDISLQSGFPVYITWPEMPR